MDYEKAYKAVLQTATQWIKDGCTDKERICLECVFPELRESENERIRKALIDALKVSETIGELKFRLPYPTREECIAYLEKQKENTWSEEDNAKVKVMCEEGDLKPSEKAWLKDLKNRVWKEQKSIKIEVYEVGKGTTVCGQDYKCKKDYKVGNCWYIKDVIYHCSRDGYLNDQNDVSWSCTPEWFKEYIYTNSELADKEKNDFVSGQFIQCKRSFDGFKEGEHYWLEYIDDDMYVGRSDNILNQKFHITPRQLYTLFSQKLEEVQGLPQEENQVSLNYEPPFNENPSDIEIIDALIKHLKEQDGFLTAIDCVSTKAILSWLEKQKEQKPTEKQDYSGLTDIERAIHRGFLCVDVENVPVGIIKETAKDCITQMKPAEWSEEDKSFYDSIMCEVIKEGMHPTPAQANWLKTLPERFNLQPKQEWSEKDENIINNICDYLLGVLRLSDAAKGKAIVFLNSLRPPKGWKEGWCEDCKVRYNHWKPSEEQMDALKELIDDAHRDGWVTPGAAELYEQLKKLM